MLDFIQKIIENFISIFYLIDSFVSGFQYGAVITIIVLLCICLGKNSFRKLLAWITNQW